MVIKQRKKDFPKWGRISRKKNKALANKVLEEIMRGYTGAGRVWVTGIKSNLSLSPIISIL